MNQYQATYADGSSIVVDSVGRATVTGRQAHLDYMAFLRSGEDSLQDFLIDLFNRGLPDDECPSIEELHHLYPEYELEA